MSRYDGHDSRSPSVSDCFQVDIHPEGTEVGGQEQLCDQSWYLSPAKVAIVFAGVGASLFVALLDAGIVATAIDTISDDIGGGKISSWVGTAYLATSASFQPLWGRCSDIFGRKQALAWSIVVFLVGTSLCASAQTMLQLVVYRGLQGMGGAGMGVLAFIIISDVVSLRDRGKYEGILAAVRALGTSLGPLVGGGLASVWWPLIFIVVIPFVIIAFGIVVFLLPLKPIHSKESTWNRLRQIDIMGSILTFASTILLLLGINWGSTTYGWSEGRVIVVLVLGSALIPFFVMYESLVPKFPTVPPELLKDYVVLAAVVQAFANGAAQFGVIFFVSQWAQVSVGQTPLIAGVLLIPFAICQSIFSPLAGYIVSRTNQYKIIMLIGYSIYAVVFGLLGWYTNNTNTTISPVIGLTTLGGFASSGVQQVSLVALQNSVDKSFMSTCTALRDFSRVSGGAFGIAIGFSLVNSSARNTPLVPQEIIQQVLSSPSTVSSGNLEIPQDQLQLMKAGFDRGYAQSFYFLAGLTTISFICVMFGVQQVSLDRSYDEEKKHEGRALSHHKN